MRVWVGTSGYSYKEWRGSFYPADLAEKKMLRYYGERLGTVEANGTFYRMPTEKALAAWTTEVGSAFVFSVKAPQRITHKERLLGSEESLTYFLKTVRVLGPHLGPILFQLPPFLKKDHARLAAFVALLPRDLHLAFEFRHASWFDEETFALLREHNLSLCVSESEKLEAPLVATADWIYLRLRREDYTSADLAEWSRKLTSMKLKSAYVYFKHEASGIGPKLAVEFRTLVENS